MADVLPDSFGLSPVLITLRTCFITVLAIVIIVGNILSITVTCRVTYLADSTKVLMMALAASDLLVGLLSLLFAVSSALDRWPFGTIGCTLVSHCIFIGLFISIFSITGLNVDRYIAITRPYKFPVWCSKRRTVSFVDIVSILAVSGSMIQYIFGQHSKYYPAIAMCSFSYTSDASNILLVFVALAIPTLVITPIYYRIIRISRQHQLRDNPNNEGNNVRDNKALKVFLMVTLTFAICYSPNSLLRLVEGLANWTSPDWLQFIAEWLFIANSAFNVFIYCLFNMAYRQMAKKVIQERILCCKHSAVGPVNI
ncbi:beta-1 adrenergic receptor-like [Acanthaster planci]|uniref:Beta-1 adrenergic receptor-like n=1 Tax=Acanthaster planci TaxID=133434 RepID=A0A8B7XMF0_ACAPL|nr:beta-1 adrenergic receptor-like [Acanthaster planci]